MDPVAGSRVLERKKLVKRAEIVTYQKVVWLPDTYLEQPPSQFRQSFSDRNFFIASRSWPCQKLPKLSKTVQNFPKPSPNFAKRILANRSHRIDPSGVQSQLLCQKSPLCQFRRSPSGRFFISRLEVDHIKSFQNLPNLSKTFQNLHQILRGGF